MWYMVYDIQYKVYGSLQKTRGLNKGRAIFWLFKGGFKVSLGIVCGIEAVMVLTLVLKSEPSKKIPQKQGS